MSARVFRRLASEHASLNNEPPPDYILPESTQDDLTILEAVLVGPLGTPYEQGAFKIVIKCTDQYPTSPPTANFKTKIWHPNVDEKSGEVCVDTLKTGWTPTTTLRDVLQVIRSLMIHPNPASALNSEAGLLAEEDYKAFCRQARLMTKIYAAVGSDLKAQIKTMRQKAEAEGAATAAAAAMGSPATPAATGGRHRKTPSAASAASGPSSSAARRPGSANSGKRSFDAMNEQPPAALSTPTNAKSMAPPPPGSSHGDNALHTPTKPVYTNPLATPYSQSSPYDPFTHKSGGPSSHHHLNHHQSVTNSTGKENDRCVSPSPRSRSSSPLGKRTFDEANEDAELETNIRGEVDREMSPPPAKRRSLDMERPKGLVAAAAAAIKESGVVGARQKSKRSVSGGAAAAAKAVGGSGVNANGAIAKGVVYNKAMLGKGVGSKTVRKGLRRL